MQRACQRCGTYNRGGLCLAVLTAGIAMKLGISPINDFAFAKTFARPENKIALISLLNAHLDRLRNGAIRSQSAQHAPQKPHKKTGQSRVVHVRNNAKIRGSVFVLDCQQCAAQIRPE